MRKKLKVLHTADWHLGQRFYEYDRKNEHQKFLDWLRRIIKDREIDLLIIAGDIFDTSAPSASSQQLFYDFLYKLTLLPKKVRVIIIAGNHDGASRLEAPSQLMNILNISVIGSVKKKDGEIELSQMIIDLKDDNDETEAYVVAVPFLRQGDYPVVKDADNTYTAGVAKLYAILFDEVNKISDKDIPVIGVGHLHCATASLSDSEKGIRGGLEMVDDDSVDVGYDYIGFGHIHKSQRISGKDHIRYSGSPIPMSFSEVNYKHKIIEIDFDGKDKTIDEIEIPRSVDLIRIGTPENPVDKDSALNKLKDIPEISNNQNDVSDKEFPFLEINILLETPDLYLANTIKELVETRCVRLASSRVYYKKGEIQEDIIFDNIEQFQEISPVDMLNKIYSKRYSSEIPENILSLFDEAVHEAEQEEDDK